MRKKLKLTNFQSHTNTSIEFARGITGIIGESLSGKSRIVQAIRWLLNPSKVKPYNKFDKDKKTTVKLSMEKQLLLKREDKKQSYKFDGQIYRKFGRNAPEEIVEFINLDDINLQRQFDQPVLVLSTPGKITKTISSIASSEIFDNAIKIVRNNLQIKRAEKKVIGTDRESIRIRLDELEVLDDIEPYVKKLGSIEEKLHELSTELEFIEKINENIGEIKTRMNASGRVEILSISLEDAVNIDHAIKSLEDERELIKDTMSVRSRLRLTNRRIKSNTDKLIKLLKKKKKCPFCSGNLTKSKILKIANGELH